MEDVWRRWKMDVCEREEEMEDGYILGRERKRWRIYIVEGGEDIYILGM